MLKEIVKAAKAPVKARILPQGEAPLQQLRAVGVGRAGPRSDSGTEPEQSERW